MERVQKLVSHRKTSYSMWISGCMCLGTLALVTYNMALVRNLTADLNSQSESENIDPKAVVDIVKRELDSPFKSPPAPGGGGAVYIRWGRMECPETEAELVYKGYTAGTHFTQLGGASNILCLPEEPIFDKHDSKPTNLGEMWGAEYEFGANSFPFSQANSPGGKVLNNHNVPCAVCRTATRSTTLMIPARNMCYSGWTMEYKGYLVSGYKNHKARSQYLCMDGEPEAEEAGFRNEDGTLFYSVDGVCGSLPCPPYIAGQELTCVVCSK